MLNIPKWKSHATEEEVNAHRESSSAEEKRKIESKCYRRYVRRNGTDEQKAGEKLTQLLYRNKKILQHYGFDETLIADMSNVGRYLYVKDSICILKQIDRGLMKLKKHNFPPNIGKYRKLSKLPDKPRVCVAEYHANPLYPEKEIALKKKTG